MNPTPTPPESSAPRRAVAGLSLAALLVAAALALGTVGNGCSRPPKVDGDPKGSGAGADPWKAAASRLKKETDLTATKTVLGALTSDVSNKEGEKLPAVTEESLNAIATVVPLSEDDRKELRGASFSAHDPVYLADCLYLRDAARSLALAGLPPDKQAEVAFAWVCRQVYLQPWPRPIDGGFEPTALPPTAVLRRGFGSGLERIYVFLALLQQLELDGCLIGGPDAGNVESRMGPALTYPHVGRVRVQRGPFWAVGVRVGNDVRLFDPWRGQPFPVTFNQLKANPEAAKGWFEEKPNISAVTLDDAKKATVFLAVPVNALSPRMAMFEAKLKGELGVKVAYEQKALEARRAAFPDPKPAFWNPPDDPFAYGRVARSYLPAELGGSDRSPASATRLYESSLRNQIPASAFQLPEGLPPESPARDRIAVAAVDALVGAFLAPPNPRERIQRGQFQDAARDLVAKQEAFATGLERLRSLEATAQAQQIREWIEAANKLYGEQTLAQLNKDKQAEAGVMGQIDQHWRQPPAQWLVDKGSAEVGRAEAAMLLALCKHEMAERAQLRLERTPADARAKADATDAWKTAYSAWRTYEQLAPAHAGFPGRAAHARPLSLRAAKLAEGEPKK